MLYVVFLQANLVCRLTLLITHGLPFLKDKAITLIIKIIYVTYNLILMFLTLLVLRRIYTFMNTYDTNLCYLFKLISINFSCILYPLYMYFNYEKIDYMKIYKQDVKLSYLTIILLSIFPILLILNVTSIFFKNVLNYFTVYCEPGEATSNNNSQINDNGQSNNTTEGGGNNNKQGNGNFQESSTKSSKNNNNQTNLNDQRNLHPLFSQEYSLEHTLLNFQIRLNIKRDIELLLANKSYWECIDFLSKGLTSSRDIFTISLYDKAYFDLHFLLLRDNPINQAIFNNFYNGNNPYEIFNYVPV